MDGFDPDFVHICRLSLSKEPIKRFIDRFHESFFGQQLGNVGSARLSVDSLLFDFFDPYGKTQLVQTSDDLRITLPAGILKLFKRSIQLRVIQSEAVP